MSQKKLPEQRKRNTAKESKKLNAQRAHYARNWIRNIPRADLKRFIRALKSQKDKKPIEEFFYGTLPIPGGPGDIFNYFLKWHKTKDGWHFWARLFKKYGNDDSICSSYFEKINRRRRKKANKKQREINKLHIERRRVLGATAGATPTQLPTLVQPLTIEDFVDVQQESPPIPAPMTYEEARQAIEEIRLSLATYHASDM